MRAEAVILCLVPRRVPRIAWSFWDGNIPRGIRRTGSGALLNLSHPKQSVGIAVAGEI